MAAFGLRGKSLLALVLACLLALVPAGLIGWSVLNGIHDHFGEAYARNATLLSREKISAPISRSPVGHQGTDQLYGLVLYLGST